MGWLRDRSGAVRDEAYKSLVRTAHSALTRHAQRLYDDPQDVEDAVDDAFTGAWRVIHDGGHVNERWLLTFIDNRRKDRGRRERTRDAVWGQLIHDAQSAAARGDDLDLRIDLNSVLDALSPDDRYLIELLDMDGNSAGEVAEMLGRSQAAVRKRRQRIHERLRELLVAAGIGLNVGDRHVF